MYSDKIIYLYHVAFKFSPIIHSNEGIWTTHGQVLRIHGVDRKTLGFSVKGVHMKIHQDSSFLRRSSNVSLPKNIEKWQLFFTFLKKTISSWKYFLEMQTYITVPSSEADQSILGQTEVTSILLTL